MFPENDEKFDAKMACIGYACALWAILDADELSLFFGTFFFVSSTIFVMIIFIRRNLDDV